MRNVRRVDPFRIIPKRSRHVTSSWPGIQGLMSRSVQQIHQTGCVLTITKVSLKGRGRSSVTAGTEGLTCVPLDRTSTMQHLVLFGENGVQRAFHVASSTTGLAGDHQVQLLHHCTREQFRDVLVWLASCATTTRKG